MDVSNICIPNFFFFNNKLLNLCIYKMTFFWRCMIKKWWEAPSPIYNKINKIIFIELYHLLNMCNAWTLVLFRVDEGKLELLVNPVLKGKTHIRFILKSHKNKNKNFLHSVFWKLGFLFKLGFAIVFSTFPSGFCVFLLTFTVISDQLDSDGERGGQVTARFEEGCKCRRGLA